MTSDRTDQGNVCSGAQTSLLLPNCVLRPTVFFRENRQRKVEMMLKTRVTEFYGIDYPILQGGLMWLARAELVAAVANAGGIGFMTALTHPKPEELRNEIRKTRDLTNKPFGINFTFLPTLIPINYDKFIDVAIEEGIKFIETAGRNPEPYMEKFKSAGMKIIHKCTSVKHAMKAQAIGCDLVSIDGFECAGHPGEDDVTSLILIPRTVDALDIPVVASGGFGDGRGLVAALALGAEGMNMGTRFLATREMPVHENLKQALLNATEKDTRLIMRTLRNTERVWHNSVVDKVLEIESKGNTKIEDLAPLVSGAQGRAMYESGDLNQGIWSVGQVVGLINDVPTIKELIDRIVAEATAIISKRLPQMLP